jgi:hypothetical protein
MPGNLRPRAWFSRMDVLVGTPWSSNPAGICGTSERSDGLTDKQLTCRSHTELSAGVG